MEKYGFIYLWYDRKRKMFYVGSHWGTEIDGYICSSNRMRDAYRRRPNDFKRRIMEKVFDRSILLDTEHKWLSMISEEELGKRYYNLRKHKWGHWSTDNEKRKTVGQKISESHKNDPNWGSWSKGKPLSEESKKKLSVSVSKTMTPEHRALLSEKCSGWTHTDEAKEKIRQAGIGREYSEESRRKIGQAQKGKIVSEETRQKLRTAFLGKKRGPYKKKTESLL